jgi:hypothetical protein
MLVTQAVALEALEGISGESYIGPVLTITPRRAEILAIAGSDETVIALKSLELWTVEAILNIAEPMVALGADRIYGARQASGVSAFCCESAAIGLINEHNQIYLKTEAGLSGHLIWERRGLF